MMHRIIKSNKGGKRGILSRVNNISNDNAFEKVLNGYKSQIGKQYSLNCI